MEMSCARCGHRQDSSGRLFCSECGKVLDTQALRTVRLAGAVGVRHSSSPALEAFWESGDPEVFADRKLRGRRMTPA